MFIGSFVPCFPVLHAQKKASKRSQTEDVLYLKDDSIVRGELIELVVDEHVRIEILGGSQFVYTFEEIERIAEEPIDIAKMKRLVRGPHQHLEASNSVYGGFHMGFAPGRDAFGWFNMGVFFEGRIGYQIKPAMGFGLGISSQKYGVGEVPWTTALFAEYRTVIPTSPEWSVQPTMEVGLNFLSQRTGWFGTFENEGTGLHVSPRVHIALPSRKSVHSTFSLGFVYNSTKYRINDAWSGERATYDLDVLRFLMAYGLSF